MQDLWHFSQASSDLIREDRLAQQKDQIQKALAGAAILATAVMASHN
jgi:hypothetical protein